MKADTKLYELAFLLKDPEAEKAIDALLMQHGGVMASKGQTKPIKLAYPIEKHVSAFFGYMQFEMQPENIEKISHALMLAPNVIRFLVTIPPAVKKPAEKRPEDGKKVSVKREGSKSVLTNDALEEKLAALESEVVAK